MPTYAIGDVQGCFTELENLLNLIQFNPLNDVLWFTGDIVNRGPRSLDVLRYIRSLGESQVVVLGNHDLHLLAVAYGVREKHRSDTIDDILTAPDKWELMDWLRRCPLLHYDKSTHFVMTHAGLAPSWSLQQAQTLAQEVEVVLRGLSPEIFLRSMFGNQPDYWDNALMGEARLRCIINYLTRMRFCYADGRLDLSYKGEIANKPAELIPWFAVPDRVNANEKILFGHWAALGGKTQMENVFALDTGCAWGNCLTAMRLEDKKRFTVSC